jgi:hypothetical protein
MVATWRGVKSSVHRPGDRSPGPGCLQLLPVAEWRRLRESFLVEGERGGVMLKQCRPNGSAKWAVRALLAGALVVGPVTLGAADASTSSAAACTYGTDGGALPAECTITGSATVGAGSLAVAAPSTIKWTTTLTGTDTVVQRQVTITAVDATGSGSGWNLTASATPFTDSTGTTKCTPAAPCIESAAEIVLTSRNTGSKAYADDTTPPGATCATGSTCTLPKNSGTYPVTIPLCLGLPSGTSSGTNCTPASLASGAATSGMGAVTLATDWWLPIPADAYAGTYTSTITLSIVSGP